MTNAGKIAALDGGPALATAVGAHQARCCRVEVAHDCSQHIQPSAECAWIRHSSALWLMRSKPGQSVLSRYRATDGLQLAGTGDNCR